MRTLLMQCVEGRQAVVIRQDRGVRARSGGRRQPTEANAASRAQCLHSSIGGRLQHTDWL